MEGEKVVVERQEIETFFAENALKCPDGMKIISLEERRSVISVDMDNMINMYGNKNIYNNYGEVIGVYFEKEYYALPQTKRNISMIQSFGILRDPNFFFYLDDDEYPMDEEIRKIWNNMMVRGSKEREDEFTQDCKRWATIKGVQPVPNKELANCLLIPDSGIRVRDSNDEYDDRTYYPLVSYLSPQTISEVGLYTTYENRTMFVNYDGKTYMAKGNHIVNLLKSLNYRALFYFLPIRENEIISDKKIRSAWEEIPEVNDPEPMASN